MLSGAFAVEADCCLDSVWIDVYALCLAGVWVG